MPYKELTAPVAVLQSQIRASYCLTRQKLRSGPLRGLQEHEYADALRDAIDAGLVSKKLRPTKRGLSLLRHG